MKWKSILGTLLVIAAIVLDWHWFWIVLAIPVTIQTFVKGEINFFEYINRENDPFIFWVQMTILILFDCYMIYEAYGKYF